ncbi:MAG TPA: hypothetical protein VHO28_07395 [Ignavibacteriales bacterium]|nr:hypothetical protein [Ignavibacteriales bacterium]HEX3072027.1 hypothetical protein [Ignavibacteriales bacterium]
MQLKNDTITISNDVLKKINADKSKLDAIKERINNNFYNSEKVIDYTASKLFDRIESDLEIDALNVPEIIEEKQPARFGVSTFFKAAFLVTVGFMAAYVIFVAIMTAVNGGASEHIGLR